MILTQTYLLVIPLPVYTGVYWGFNFQKVLKFDVYGDYTTILAELGLP